MRSVGMRSGGFALQWFFAKADDGSFPPAARDASFFFAERLQFGAVCRGRLPLFDVSPRGGVQSAIGQGCAAPLHVALGFSHTVVRALHRTVRCMHRVAGSPKRTCGHHCHISNRTGAHPCHVCTPCNIICAGTGLTPAHICAGTGLSSQFPRSACDGLHRRRAAVRRGAPRVL